MAGNPHETHYVEIIRRSDAKCIKRMGPLTERSAERVESGVNINLDHEGYFTELVESDETLMVGDFD